jgi:hypothetical protein
MPVFTIEFFRVRPRDNAHATLDRILERVPDLEAAKVRAKSLFETLNMPQKPDDCASWMKMDASCFSGAPRMEMPEGQCRPCSADCDR